MIIFSLAILYEYPISIYEYIVLPYASKIKKGQFNAISEPITIMTKEFSVNQLLH